MPSVRFIDAAGKETVVEARDGASIMQTAVANGISGIVAECGGSAMCATCHVYVAPEWVEKIPGKKSTEDAMLDSTVCPRQSNSRLSCQIVMTREIDGIVVCLPEAQV